jgi:DNA-directed RNA polymerase subunit N (RpoN/RPB10)
MIDRIADGRTDLVFDYLGEGHLATSKDSNGTSLIEWCAYYGDVSAIKFLLANGESLQPLRDNLGLNAACCRRVFERDGNHEQPAKNRGDDRLQSAGGDNSSKYRLYEDHRAQQSARSPRQ